MNAEAIARFHTAFMFHGEMLSTARRYGANPPRKLVLIRDGPFLGRGASAYMDGMQKH